MSIKQKLYLIAAIALVGFVAIFAETMYATKTILKYETITNNVLEAEVNLLQARRSEKDFLSRKLDKYVGRNKSTAKAAIVNLRVVVEQDQQLTERIDDSIAKINQYSSLFQNVAAKVTHQGLTEKEGLRGNLRSTIHEAEDMIKTVDDDSMLAAMLMLRRREKDFIIRKDFKYFDKFNADMVTMQGVVSASTALDEGTAAQLQTLLQNYSKAFTQYVESEKAIQAEQKRFTAAAHELENNLNELMAWSDETLENAIYNVKLLSLITQICAILGVTLSVFFVVRSILRPLSSLQECSRNVAAGDYDSCQSIKLTGELEDLRTDVVAMVDTLKEAMDDATAKGRDAELQAKKATEAMNQAKEKEEHTTILVGKMTRVAESASDIAHRLASAAAELSNQAGGIVQGAELQREQVTSTATAMEEMNATVLEVAHNSSDAAESANQNREQAVAGQEKVAETVNAVLGVQTTTTELAEVMDDLNQKAESIGTVMNVITDIADQTNLLALNAAIEAARAGEAGRGFAVVADEVRKLAEKTMSATQEVGQAIDGIQSAVGSSVTKSKDADAALEKATEHAQTAGQLLGDIVITVQNSADMVRSIATAAEQQSATSEEINRSVEEINRISDETANSMGESAQAIDEIAALADDLNRLIVELNEAAAA